MFGLLSYGAVLLSLVIGAVLRPPIALAGVICLFGLKQWGQTSSPLLAQYPTLTNFVIGALTLVAVLRAAFRRSCLFCRVPAAEICIGFLLLYALLSLTWSLDPESGLETWSLTAPYLAVVVFLSPLVIDDLQDLRTAFRWLTVTGGAICALAVVFGTWGIRGLQVELSLGDAGAATVEASPLAIAELGGTVAIAAGIFLIERRRLLFNIVAACAIPFALAAIIRSGSRGQLIAIVPAFLIAASVALRLRGIRSWSALALLILLIVGLGWWATSLVDVDKARWLGTENAADAVEGRLQMAGVVLDAALAHPLTMLIGLGNSSSFRLLGIYPHIAIAEVLAEEGLPGISLYLAILIYSVASIRRAASALVDDPARRVTLGVLTGVFVYELVLSWKQGSLLGSPYVFCYAIVLGRVALALAPGLQRAPPVEAPVRAFPNLMS